MVPPSPPIPALVAQGENASENTTIFIQPPDPEILLAGAGMRAGVEGPGGGATVNTPSEQDGILPPPSPAQELHPMAALAGHTRNGPTNRGKGVLS